jgi:acetyl-CoA carboxylase carboxyltransferase component
MPDNPNRSYDVREVIKRVVDGSDFLKCTRVMLRMPLSVLPA